MKTLTQKTGLKAATAGTLALLMVGCASYGTHEPPGKIANVNANSAADKVHSALACTVPSNCVNSFDSSGLAPLRFEGTPAQAQAALRATLAEFPEATIVKADDLFMAVVFSTPAGFKDRVDFKIDAQAKRIDYRSRSSFGLYDFGKNRSRMTAFTARFEALPKR